MSRLGTVQPVDLTASEIAVRLGATWLPTEVIDQFIYELFGTSLRSRRMIRSHYSQHTGAWNIENKFADRGNIKAENTYGTTRVNGYKIIEETLNLRDLRIFDYVEDEHGNRVPVLNKKGNGYRPGQAGTYQAGVPGLDLERPSPEGAADAALQRQVQQHPAPANTMGAT